MDSTIDQQFREGLKAHKAGDLDEAERYYRLVLSSMPNHPDANHNLGVIAVSVNHAMAALPFFEAALSADTSNEQYWISYARSLIRSNQPLVARAAISKARTFGHTSERIRRIEESLAELKNIEQPSKNRLEVDVRILLDHYKYNRFHEAELFAKKLIEQFPNHGLVWKVLSSSLHVQGKLTEAVNAGEKATTLLPDDAEVLNNLGNTFFELKNFAQAKHCYEEAVSIQSDYSEALNNLGSALKELHEFKSAEDSFRQAILANPESAEAYFNLGVVLTERGEASEAKQCYLKALVLEPNYPKAHLNLGKLYADEASNGKAKHHLQQARLLDGTLVEAHANLGNVLVELGDLEQAEQSLRKAIELCSKSDRRFGGICLNLGILRLRKLDFKNGFELSEWRWRTDQTVDPSLVSTKPRWSGESGKRVFVWSEQGIGDVLMFASLINELKVVCSWVLVRCDERLKPLFERSFTGNITFVSGNGTIVAPTQYDFQIAIGSLPAFFREDIESFEKGSGAYLRANLEKTDRIRSQLKDGTAKKIYGISWKGGSKNSSNKKSIELIRLANILSSPDRRIVSLQYGVRDEELRALKTEFGIDIASVREIDNFHDIDDLSALVCACDHVISIENFIAHLSGSLGVDTAVLLPFSAEWRWAENMQSSYWHSSLSLFRQSTIGDWSEPLEQLKQNFLTKRV